MGNLFLGFPVARAKIADMISTAAPPLAHHEQHENGGEDEIDVTGLTGAGGSGIALDSLFTFGSTFESLSGYTTTPSGSGATSVDAAGVLMSTGATANSLARCDKSTTYVTIHNNFSRNRVLIAQVRFDCLVSVTGSFEIFTGGRSTTRKIGFRVSAGVLKGAIANGTTESTVDLQTLGVGSYSLQRSLKAVFTSGVKCEFYVDEVLLGTITTNLPSGIGTAMNIFNARAENPGVAEDKYLTVSAYNVLIQI